VRGQGGGGDRSGVGFFGRALSNLGVMLITNRKACCRLGLRLRDNTRYALVELQVVGLTDAIYKGLQILQNPKPVNEETTRFGPVACVFW
jgi:hypothetical protein